MQVKLENENYIEFGPNDTFKSPSPPVPKRIYNCLILIATVEGQSRSYIAYIYLHNFRLARLTEVTFYVNIANHAGMAPQRYVKNYVFRNRNKTHSTQIYFRLKVSVYFSYKKYISRSVYISYSARSFISHFISMKISTIS